METLSQLIIILFGITLPCCILTARYVRKRQRAILDNTIDVILKSLQEIFPDVVINQKTISLNKLDKINKAKPSKLQEDLYDDEQHPYDVESEEIFERIIKNEDWYK